MALTQGHEVICCDRNRRGGIKKIWLIEQDKLDGGPSAVVFDSSASPGPYHLITAFPTSFAYQFDFERGTAGFTANATRENGSTLVNVELEFYIPKITMEINARLSELTESCGVFAIVESFADDCDTPIPETYYFVLGFDKVFEEKAYLEFASGEQSTGVGLQDANGTAIKLAGVQAEYPRELNFGATAGMVTMAQAGGADFTDPWVISLVP